jgi:hypothetical protein
MRMIHGAWWRDPHGEGRNRSSLEHQQPRPNTVGKEANTIRKLRKAS